MTKITQEKVGFSAQVVTMVGIYSCTSMRDVQMEQSLGNAMKSGKLFKIKSLRRDVHEIEEGCLLHSAEMCFSSAEIDASRDER